MCVVRHKSQRWRGHTPCGSDAEDEAHCARQAQRAAAPSAARVRRRAQLAAARSNITVAWVAAARLGNTNRVVGRQGGRFAPPRSISRLIVERLMPSVNVIAELLGLACSSAWIDIRSAGIKY
jgi:hypothetical protein